MTELIIITILLCFLFHGEPDVYDKLHCKIMDNCKTDCTKTDTKK
jgi:hypothetical protein